MANIRNGEIVIEIDHQRTIDDTKLGSVTVGNSDVHFYPAGTNLRSRIQPWRSRGVKPVWHGVPVIPGQRVHVDVKAMKARITDALGDEENVNILKAVKRAVLESNGAISAIGGGISGAIPESKHNINSAEELHNWLYWMRRLVDDRMATIVQGDKDLASEETLRNGGDIRIPGSPHVAKAESGSVYMRPTKTEKVAAS